MIKTLNFKVGSHVRISKYQNIFVKGYVPNCSEEVFMIKKLKLLCRGHRLLVILMVNKKNYKKQIKKSLELRKDYMSNGKSMRIHLTVVLIKKISLHKISYFREPYTPSKNEMKAELDLSNFETIFDLKM